MPVQLSRMVAVNQKRFRNTAWRELSDSIASDRDIHRILVRNGKWKLPVSECENHHVALGRARRNMN